MQGIIDHQLDQIRQLRIKNTNLEKRVESLSAKIDQTKWQAFSEQTRLYLVTAEQVYTVLTEQEEKPDYSLVGMELCKALETEINQRRAIP